MRDKLEDMCHAILFMNAVNPDGDDKKEIEQLIEDGDNVGAVRRCMKVASGNDVKDAIDYAHGELDDGGWGEEF